MTARGKLVNHNAQLYLERVTAAITTRATTKAAAAAAMAPAAAATCLFCCSCSCCWCSCRLPWHYPGIFPGLSRSCALSRSVLYMHNTYACVQLVLYLNHDHWLDGWMECTSTVCQCQCCKTTQISTKCKMAVERPFRLSVGLPRFVQVPENG